MPPLRNVYCYHVLQADRLGQWYNNQYSILRIEFRDSNVVIDAYNFQESFYCSEPQIFFKFVSVVAFDSNNCIAIYEFECDCNNFITQTITPANSLIRSQHFVVEELQQTNCILLYLYGLLKFCFFQFLMLPKRVNRFLSFFLKFVNELSDSETKF